MLGRFLVFMTTILFGPLFIEVYLYHPLIVLEHDPVAIIPLIISPLAVFSGYLLLAADSKVTAAIFALVCAVAVAVGVAGTAIHIAMHAPTIASMISDPNVWLGEPPPLVPLSFAAGGCMGLIPVALPGHRMLAEPPVAIARILYAMAAVCGLAGVVGAAQVEGGTIALIAVIAALGFGTFGFTAEIAVLAYPVVRARFVRS